ncbi:efflux RND transporter permease subunit [Granulosicoccus sp. 3-233]|uniref:efflux RND transporter permease subunit n=1 Tax=Granulosicoccus sp. 3-233 TaxID=3417969 RepID=UPI003D356EFC
MSNDTQGQLTPSDDSSLTSSKNDFTSLFVRRPVLSTVLSLLVIVAGLAAIVGVEIRELPAVDSPVISVTTTYSGASPETIDREVTAVIESAAGRVPGVQSISSSSSFGSSRVTVDFKESTDLDVAASDMRDAIARVSRDLPEDVDDPRIVKADSDAEAVMRLAVTSDRLSAEEMTIIVENQIVDNYTAVNGVADVQVYGDREQVFRVDVDQTKLASRGLSIADLAGALEDAAFDTPAGSLSSDTQDLSVRATATVNSAAEFETLLIDERTRIGDIATVTLGADIGSSSLRANGRTGIGMGIIRQAGSNTLEISDSVRAVTERLNQSLPEGMEVRVTSDDAVFIRGSIKEVLLSISLAIAIVISIIYVFLLNWRATLIPAITLPVALIGTVAGIWLAGFSINILTLLALLLATGMVVDDAIVVLENIVNRRNDGAGPKAAAVIGTRQVFFAVITTTAVLAAVFVPLSFLPGKAGGLFREFGFVLAIAVTISSMVALTLCPMLASRLLKDTPVPGNAEAAQRSQESASRNPVRRFGNLCADLYASVLKGCLRMPWLVVGGSLLMAALAWFTLASVPEELIPREDRSVALLRISAPQGVSLDYTAAQLRKIEDVVQPLVENGEAENVFSLAGRGGSSNSGFMVVTLKPWEDRDRSQQDIVDDINAGLRTIPGVRAFAIQPNSLGIRGAGSGLKVAIAGSSYQTLAATADSIVEQLEQDPRFGRVELGYETNQAQLSISIDRERAADLGIDITGLAAAMQSVLDGRDIGDVFIEDRAVAVKLLSTTQPVNDPTDLANLFLRTSDGRIVPMSTIASLTESAIAPSLPREERSRAVTITAGLTPEMALRTAMQEFESIATPLLESDMRLIPLAEAASLNETSSGLALTFGFAIVIVFLVLAAQFESFVSALIIMFTVPFGLASAVFALYLTGTSLNVYSQIGLVLLVGIMAKNGILIVEFANQLRDEGMSVAEASLQAATIRLRPVAMTLFSTVLGGVPLVLASGAGAEARTALGWVIVGGLGIATFFTLFLTPVAYRLLAGFSTSKGAANRQLTEELQRVNRGKAVMGQAV